MPKRSPLFVFPDFYFEKVSAICSYHVCPRQQQSLNSKIWGQLWILNRLDWVGYMNYFSPRLSQVMQQNF